MIDPITVGNILKKQLIGKVLYKRQDATKKKHIKTIEGHSSNYVVNFDFLKDEDGNPIESNTNKR